MVNVELAERGDHKRMWLTLFALLVACGVAACGVPRDMRGTLERIEREKSLRVGLVENAPWVVRANIEPSGIEIELIKRFAAELGSTPVWSWRSEEAHATALEDGELDLVVGGLTDETPWSDHVGVTHSYYEDDEANRVILVPPGENALLMRLESFFIREREGIKREVENARGAAGR